MKTCSIFGCERKYCANGYCAAHNALYKRHGDPLVKKSRWDGYAPIEKQCLTPGCDSTIPKGNHCSKCRQRKYRHGDMLTVKPTGNKDIWKLAEKAANEKPDITWSEFKKNKTKKVSYNTIRAIGRKLYAKSNRPKCCLICGWAIYEICHIRSVSNFKDEEMISEINKPTNLIALCPNHHDAFDKGLIALDIKGSKTFEILRSRVPMDEYVAVVRVPNLFLEGWTKELLKEANKTNENGWMTKPNIDKS